MGFFSFFFGNKSTQIQKQLEISWVKRGEAATCLGCKFLVQEWGFPLGVAWCNCTSQTRHCFILFWTQTSPWLWQGTQGTLSSLCILQDHDSCARAAVTLMDHSHQPPLAPSADTSPAPLPRLSFPCPHSPAHTQRWVWVTIFCWMTILVPSQFGPLVQQLSCASPQGLIPPAPRKGKCLGDPGGLIQTSP